MPIAKTKSELLRDMEAEYRLLKWNQLPALNDRIYWKWKTASAEVVLAEFDSTYARMTELARALPERTLPLDAHVATGAVDCRQHQ